MIAAFIKGILLGIMLAISVGPIIFSIIKQSINNGHKGGFTFVAGVSASDITLVLVSQLFTELFRYLLEYKKTIGIGGSILLIGIGIYVLFFKKVIMFSTCLVFVLSTDIAKVLLAGSIRQKLTPHNIHILNKISGLILMGFGLALIWGTLEFGDKLH